MVNAVRTATVFDIQKYSIHDGPGIRTVVFFKGCPLRCKWCANPESWSAAPQLFYVASRCVGCGACHAAAPKGMVAWKAGEHPSFDFGAANAGKLDWPVACMTGALQVKGAAMTVEEILAIVMQDEIFYRQSGGGVTLSGGEPLMQAQAAVALLGALRERNIHTAVETTGYVPEETLLRTLPLVDLFLYDFKTLDSDKHRRCTGVDNARIRTNLRLLLERGAHVVVRMPLIPGVNDDAEEMRRTVAYLKELGVTRFALLPFHQLGRGKYASIGQPYALSELAPPDEAHVEALQKMIAAAGLSDRCE